MLYLDDLNCNPVASRVDCIIWFYFFDLLDVNNSWLINISVCSDWGAGRGRNHKILDDRWLLAAPDVSNLEL